MEAAGRLLHRDWDLYDTRHAVFRPARMTPRQLEEGYWRAYRDFYRWGSILRGAATKPDLAGRLRHAAYAVGWKKCEPVWDLLIRARRVGRALPLLERVLAGRPRPGERNRRRHRRHPRPLALPDPGRTPSRRASTSTSRSPWPTRSRRRGSCWPPPASPAGSCRWASGSAARPQYQQALKIVRSGTLGKIRLVKVWAYQGWMKPVPVLPDSAPPAGVDYDMWLGPAPKRPFNPNRFHFNFRWFWDYAGGLMTDWGVHEIDIALWVMDAKAPKSVMASGGKVGYPDDASETPDTLQAVFEYDGFNMLWEHATGIDGGNYGRTEGIAFIGNNGTLVVNRGGWELLPETTEVDGQRRYRMEALPPWADGRRRGAGPSHARTSSRRSGGATPPSWRAAWRAAASPPSTRTWGTSPSRSAGRSTGTRPPDPSRASRGERPRWCRSTTTAGAVSDAPQRAQFRQPGSTGCRHCGQAARTAAPQPAQ